MHSFPPFYTLQRNATTLASQLMTWSKLIMSYCQHYRIFILDVEGAWQRRQATGAELFGNKRIDRHLNEEAIRTVFKTMVERGEAAWEPPLPKSTAKTAEQTGKAILVFWHSPDEWGSMIADWIVRTGQNGSIMTFFELTEGDLVQSEGTHIVRLENDLILTSVLLAAFANLPQPLLRLALSTLESKGRARVFEGTESSEGMAGVKFA
jgi:ESCRT-II complex subunit VPS25